MLSPLAIEIWNDSLDLALRMEREGDDVVSGHPVAIRNLCYLGGFDSVVMSGGLDEAISRYSPERMELVASAFEYYGLPDLASLVQRLAASDKDYAAAQDLNVAYWEGRGRHPGESLIDAALEHKLRAEPRDFGIES